MQVSVGVRNRVSTTELLRRRGMHIERGFAHILDAGGMRRTTLRGWENLNKRYKLAAAFYNLSQLMRKIFGFGTPKQLAAAQKGAGQVVLSELTCFFMTLWPCTMRLPQVIKGEKRRIDSRLAKWLEVVS